MSNKSAVEAYLNEVSARLGTVVKCALDNSPEITEFISELNSVGVFVNVEHSVNVKMYTYDGWTPPSDLSRASDKEIDAKLAFTVDDLKFLADIKKAVE